MILQIVDFAILDFWVYKREFFFGGSPQLLAPLVKRYKQNFEKSVLWDTLLPFSHLLSHSYQNIQNVQKVRQQ